MGESVFARRRRPWGRECEGKGTGRGSSRRWRATSSTAEFGLVGSLSRAVVSSCVETSARRSRGQGFRVLVGFGFGVRASSAREGERRREVCCGDGALERTDPGREEGRRSPQPAAVLELAVEEQETRAPGDDPGGQVPPIDTTREGRSSPPESVRPHPGGRGALRLRHADRVLPGQLVPPGGREAAAGDVTRGS